MSDEQVCKAWGRSDGQSMAKGLKELTLCFWTWPCGFRKIILVSLGIDFTTYKTEILIFFEMEVGHTEENFYERAKIHSYFNDPQVALIYQSPVNTLKS